MEEQEKKLNEFCSISGVPIENAKFFLEAAEWNVELALLNFCDLNNTEFRNTAVVDNVNMDVDEQELAETNFGETLTGNASTTITPTFSSAASAFSSRKNTSEIGTLSNLRQDSSNSLNNSESLQAFFAGGSVYSGQQIIGPSNKNASILMGMFKAAKKNIVFKRAEEAIANTPSASSDCTSINSSVFVGPGNRLGQLGENDVSNIGSNGSTNVTTPSAVLTQSSSPLSLDESVTFHPNNQNLFDVVLRIYGNGFTVNDGPLRNLDNPIDREFIQMIMLGQVPPEIAPTNDAIGIRLKVEDHSFQEYSIRKFKNRKAVSFSGQGNVLGSTFSKENEQPEQLQQQQQNKSDIKEQQQEGQQTSTNHQLANNRVISPILVDQSSPLTNIQIRLSDGRRLRLTLNHYHTIGDIRNYISTLGPEYRDGNFRLITSFPSKALVDSKATVEQAGILNSSILLRLE